MKGSDKYIKQIMASGDINAMTEAYYKLHHTKPDEDTKKNWAKALKKIGRSA